MNPSGLTSLSSQVETWKLRTWRFRWSCIFITLGLALLTSPPTFAATSPEALMQQARAHYEKGTFGEAAQEWMDAAKLYEQKGAGLKQSDALLFLAQAFQRMGQSRNAELALTQALKLVQSAKDTHREAGILGGLGNVSFFLGKNQAAMEYLAQALKLTRAGNQTVQRAALLNDLGNVLAALARSDQALGAYADAAVVAQSTGNLALEVVALINAANVEVSQRSYVNAKARLDQTMTKVETLPDSHDKAYAYVKIGLTYDALHSTITSMEKEVQREHQSQGSPEGARGKRQIKIVPNEEVEILSEFVVRPEKQKPGQVFEGGEIPVSLAPPTLLSQAAAAFEAGAQLGARLGDPRAESFGWGYLGHMYEKNSQWKEALELTRRALVFGQQVEIPESQYQWHWQIARIHRARGEVEEARKAYQLAVLTLQPMRHEFLVGAHTRHRPFRETVGPLFFELTDLLLRKAKTLSEADQVQQYLLQARDTVELFKAAELQDYFQDQCVQTALAHSFPLEKVSGSTAILYPIILPDRLELLLGFRDGFQQITVLVPGDLLTLEARAFRKSLEDRKSTTYLKIGQQLYARLIKPLEPYLEEANIATLVVVPDGALRGIPFSALHDGKHFLIHKYAVAISPGLTLTDPRPIDRSAVRVLALGLTESAKASISSATESEIQFSPLPNVGTELESVKQVFPSTVLLNQQFTDAAMERALQGEAYNIVHIASHGLVTKDVKDTFILAHDGPITMNRLAEIIGLFKFRDSPLELLTLSACQTALGDDRAALGLAGVAVKAGARSALATLWFIDDEATSRLVPEFYRQLKENPRISKAEALQRAQLKFIADKRFHHPIYWAPFLLINNWL